MKDLMIIGMIILWFVGTIIIVGCKECNYQYTIYMKDGTIRNVFLCDPEGGAYGIFEKGKGYYYISCQEVKEVIYVGCN